MRFWHCCLLMGTVFLTMPLAAETLKSTCLDSSHVRNWIVVDDEILLLDAGRKKYRMTLMQSCFNLSSSPTLQFKGDPITGRICGSTLDAIRVNGEQCRISKIELIDKQTFSNAQNKKRHIVKVKKSINVEKK